MAVYQFSTLSDGQAISFNPSADVLQFDQSSIAAAEIRALIEGGNLRLRYVEDGKDVVLLNTAAAQITTSNVTFADGSRLLFGNDSGNSLLGTSGADHLWGLGGNDTLNGGAGDDWLAGGAGQDQLTGGTGADAYVFLDTPFNNNYDRVHGFVSGSDSIWLHEDPYAAVGTLGRFSAADARFHAAAGATSGHDADDRIIYNTSNGYLFYDADGSGAGKAMFIGILQGAPTLVASDIVLFGDEDISTPPGGATEGNDTLVGTSGNDTIDGLAGDDSISGLAGDDVLIGGPGADTLDGGLGNDTYHVRNISTLLIEPEDVLIDAGGLDTVVAPGQWTLGSGFENLILTGPPEPGNGGNLWGTGNELDNRIVSQAGPAFLNGKAGNDTLIGSDGQDLFIFEANHGSDWVQGGGTGGEWDDDWLNFQALGSGADIDFSAGTATTGFGVITFAQIEGAVGTQAGDTMVADDAGRDLRGYHGDDTLIGGAGADTLNGGGVFWDQFGATGGDDVLLGGGGTDTLYGDAGADTLNGGAGNDRLLGEGDDSDGYVDVFVFDQAPGMDNSDVVEDFGWLGVRDELHLDNRAMTDIGAAGRLASGDARFFAGAGANAGQDASDRIVYNTTTGQLWYDADGSGSGAAQLIATLQGAPSLMATDIVVIGDGGGSGPITGTDGDDTLIGTAGNDTIDGRGGNDSISGLAGNDSLIGGDGRDTLDGGPGADTMVGGLHDDVYIVDDSGDVVVEEIGGGSNDTVISYLPFYALPDWVNNLVMRGSHPLEVLAHGNELDNVLRNESANFAFMDGGAGNDTLIGGESGAMFEFGLSENHGDDVVDGQLGSLDWLHVGAYGPVTVDFRSGTVSGGGSGSVTFSGIEAVWAGWYDDLLIAADSPVQFLGSYGHDTLLGGAGDDILSGDGIFEAPPGSDPFHDWLHGGGGNDVLLGDGGNDTLNGGTGNDTLDGGPHADVFVFDETPGAANADLIRDFTSAEDELHLDSAAMPALGAGGRFAAADARFYAAPGANAGQDASDRIVYNTSTGQLWYDSDGSGSGAAQLLFTLQGAPTLTASDIVVIGEGGGGPGGVDLTGTAGNDNLAGGDGNDTLVGLAGNDTLNGNAGNDWLEGGPGQDQLTGGTGADSFVFRDTPFNNNYDRMHGFTSGTDEIVFDRNAYGSIGALGDFAASDGRFYAADGATSGHDADDRIIYNTGNGFLYYDADGSGSGKAMFVGILQGAPALAASDITVI